MRTHRQKDDDTPNRGWKTYCTATTAERIARALAGVVILTGLALGYYVSPWFYLMTAFAGVNLLQSAITGFCPPELIYNVFRRRDLRSR